MHNLHEMLSAVGDAEEIGYQSKKRKTLDELRAANEDNRVKSSDILQDAVTIHNEVIG